MSTPICLCQSQVVLSRPQHVGRRALKLLKCPEFQRYKPRFRHAPTHSRRVLHVSAAAAFELPSQQEVRRKAAARIKTPVPRPAELPPPPKSTSLLHVLPYLTKLAVSDAQLYWRLGLAFTLMIASKAAGLMAPLYFKKAVDALATQTHVAAQAAVMALLWSGGCRIVNGLAKELQHPIFTPVAQAAGRRVAYHTFSHVLDLDTGFHLERRTGALSRILERGTRSVGMMFRAVVFTFMPTAIELVLVCTLLARRFRPAVALAVLATFVVYVWWTTVMTKAATEVRKEVNELDNLTTGKAVDVLLNYETVKLFNNEQLEVDQYDAYLLGFQRASVATERVSATLNAGQSVVLTVGLTAVLTLAASGGTGVGVTAGDLVMAQGLLLQLWGPLQFLGWFYREVRQSLVDMEAFFSILQTVPKLPDGKLTLDGPSPSSTGGRSEAATPAAATPEWHEGERGRGQVNAPVGAVGTSGCGVKLELKDVHFGYTGEREVVAGVSLTVEPGQSVALVGPSGSGKSTILKLLMRLYDVTSGSINLDGIDARELQQASLRAAVAVVPQDTVLFNDTLLSNIAYGKPSASREEIVQAAEMARLTEAIGRFPDGFDTMVGERGLKLSGGEKQRVAIARAFLRAPRLLICDEATSALDTATEQGIMGSLDELATGRTSVFVAHRLSTVQRCDKIIVLSNGMVAEQGTHEELMAARRIYYDMWEVQKAADAEAEKVLESLSSFSSYDDPDTTGSNLQSGNGKHTGRELQTSQP
ncbi:hypothetical protein ABBQ38_010855 [Trebouxia sp. C0009 RCD-2024]